MTSPSVIILLDKLHCINCVQAVEQYLKTLPGVLRAHVNLTQKRAQLDIRPEDFQAEEVLAGLAQRGYPGRFLEEHQERKTQSSDSEQKQILRKMAFAGCVAGNLMLMSASLYIGQFQGIDNPLQRLFEVLSFCLATPVVIYSASHFYGPALSALRHGRVTMDFPITLGLFATYTLSTVAFFRGLPQQYFDTVTAFVFVLLVGRYFQSLGMSKVQTSLNFLAGLRPEKVRIKSCCGSREIPLAQLAVGDIVLLQENDQVPADGRLIEGFLEVEEAALTGESLPQERGKEARIYAGTRVFSGRGEYLVEAVGGSTVVSRLAQLVEESQLQRSTEGRLSSVLASRFSLLIVVMALATWCFWLPAGVDKATLVATSLLVITCPCALGLALPLAFWTAVRRGVEQGVLVRDESALEESAQITDLVLDKTGTLTSGNPTLLQETLTRKRSEQEVASLVLALEKTSTHPFALKLKSRFATFEAVQGLEVEEQIGLGRAARAPGKEYFIGRLPALKEGQFDIGLTENGELLATWQFADPIRPEAYNLVTHLQERALNLHIASGDKRETTEKVAAVLGIENFHGEMLPEDKVRLVESLQARGRKVALLGDGINDSPAMSCADVGVAMGHASVVTTLSAPVLLLRPGLAPVLSWLELARSYRQVVRRNIAISITYNLLAIPTAALGYVSPLMAAIAMPLASLAVVASSLRSESRVK